LAGILGASRSAAAGLINAGLVRVDGVSRPRSFRVVAGQMIEVAETTREVSDPPAVPPVRFEDEYLLVIAKPAGVVVHPGAGNPDGTLVDGLRAAGVDLAPAGGLLRPGIVHRLDKDTSGLMVVAKTDAAYEGLVRALQRREVVRGYVAMVEGALPGRSGQVDAPIGRDPTSRVRFAVVADGRPAITHWDRLGSGVLATRPVTLTGCRLQTGRTHQIRVHMAYAGCPVVGDPTYGASQAVADAAGLARPFLHARRLGFTHPVTGQPVEVEEPLPSELEAAVRAAGADTDLASPSAP
jgi:23S rRNA pseudouridine1911/1915/1917 synthase